MSEKRFFKVLSERAPDLEDAAFANLLQVKDLDPTLGAGDDDVAGETRMEANECWWSGERDR